MNILQRKNSIMEDMKDTDVNESFYPCTRLLAGSYLIQRGAHSYRGRLATCDVRPWISLDLHGKQKSKPECTSN
jgi:hypothetical protein